MAKQKPPLVNIQFPLGGLNRQAGFDNQPPYTSPYCQNVRPFDVVNLTSANMHGYRQRGGARPGLAKAYADAVGAGPIQMLNYAAIVNSAGATSNILLAVTAGYLYQNGTDGTIDVVAGGPQLNTTAPYLQGTQVGQKFYVADFRPVGLSGTDGTITYTSSEYRLSATSISSWSALSIDTAKDVVFVSGDIDTEANIFPITDASHAGYIVFSGPMTVQTGNVVWQIGRLPKVFDPAYPSTAITPLTTVPVPASNFRTGTISISAVGWVTLDDNTGTPWTAYPYTSVNYTTHRTTLTIKNLDGIGETEYLVESINKTTGHIQLVPHSYVEVRTNIPYVLSWTSTFYGIPPLNCSLCCTYRGRLVLAGPGSIWYMSRVLDPNDWDYGFDPQDPSRAIAGTSTTTGGIPEPLTALMPHSDSYLIFGCERSLWKLTSDPAYGGTIESLNRDVGVLSPGAWCNISDGSIVFLSRDGLYHLPPGGQSYPQPISRPKLPAELLNIDTTINVISMCYDVQDRGIHLSVTPTAGTAGVHYFLDWTAQGFWPVSMPTALQPTAMMRYAPSSTTAPTVILGSFDGYTRKYLASQTADVNANGTTTAITSFVCYGPLNLAWPGYYAEIMQINANLDSNGQGVTWGIFQGETGQDALQAAVTAGAAGSAPWTGAWVAGDNHRQYPRAVGAAFVVMLSGTYGWAIDSMQIEPKQRGTKR